MLLIDGGKGSRPPSPLLLLLAACLLAAALPAVHHGIALPLRHLISGAVTATQPAARIMPTDFGSVQRYSLPCQLPAADGGKRTVPGVLHVYLKALRWPQARAGGAGGAGGAAHHLLLKGFAAFEPLNRPTDWNRYLFHNLPEVGRTLRLMLRGGGGGGEGATWRRRVPLEFLLNACEYSVRDPGFDYQACLEEEGGKLRGPGPHPQDAFNLGHISLDLGADPPLDLELGVGHRWLPLAAQLAAAMAAPPGRPVRGSSSGGGGGSDAPPVVQAMPYLYNLTAEHVALLVARSWEYHARLGVAGLLMYVQPAAAAALAAQPAIRELAASRRLTLAAWAEFADWDHWRDFDLQIVEAHATLSLWGEGVLVLVQDLDEYVVPSTAGATLPDLLSTGCLAQLRPECRFLSRRDIFPPPPPAAAPRRAIDEPRLWRTPGPHPLLRYGVATYRPQPKSLVDPATTLPVDVHVTSACVGNDTVLTAGSDGSSEGDLRSACAERQPCAWVHPGCAWLAHVRNMLTQRDDAAPANAQEMWPAGWQWPLSGGGAADDGGR